MLARDNLPKPLYGFDRGIMNKSRVNIDDNDRYSRLELIGWWDQDRLRQSRVLVVGAGALGNEVLKNLALIGIGHITLIDLDLIENSNLSRSVLFRAADAGKPKAKVAAKMVRELNPDVSIDWIHGNVLTEMGLGQVRSMDLVIGCLDNREARLWVNRMCWKVNRPWIDGGIQEINGVAKVFRPPHGACYECAMTEMDYQLIQLRYSCPLLKHEDLQQGKVPTAPTIASIVGGIQVQEALKLLHGIPTDEGAALVFNGAANQFYKTEYQHRDDCLSHETYEPILECPLNHQSTLEQIAGWLAEQPGASQSQTASLMLDRDFVTLIECRGCQVNRQIMKPRPIVSMDDAICQNCEQPMVPEMTHLIDFDSPLAERKLADLGVPDQDVLQLAGEHDPVFVQLSAVGESG